MNTVWINYSYVGKGGGVVTQPAYTTPGSAGIDLPSDIDCHLAVLSHILIPTGFAFEIPSGYEGQVRGRSGLATKGIFVHIGTIDSDYRGEVSIVLYNQGSEVLKVNRGDRIAQLVISPVAHANLTAVLMLGATVRGAGGFGSTGQ